MKPVLIQSLIKRRQRERISPDPIIEDIHKESDRLFMFILAILAVIVVGSIAVAA